MKLLVLAEYVKTGKKLWWTSATYELWQKGKTQLISGTTTEVKIIDIIEVTDDQWKILNK